LLRFFTYNLFDVYTKFTFLWFVLLRFCFRVATFLILWLIGGHVAFHVVFQITTSNKWLCAIVAKKPRGVNFSFIYEQVKYNNKQPKLLSTLICKSEQQIEQTFSCVHILFVTTPFFGFGIYWLDVLRGWNIPNTWNTTS